MKYCRLPSKKFFRCNTKINYICSWTRFLKRIGVCIICFIQWDSFLSSFAISLNVSFWRGILSCRQMWGQPKMRISVSQSYVKSELFTVRCLDLYYGKLLIWLATCLKIKMLRSSTHTCILFLTFAYVVLPFLHIAPEDPNRWTLFYFKHKRRRNEYHAKKYTARRRFKNQKAVQFLHPPQYPVSLIVTEFM